MSWDLQQDCVDCAAHALTELKLREQTAIAQFMKKELDSKYGGSWHVVVGHSYGTVVGHDDSYFAHFHIGDLHFTIWRMDTAERTAMCSALC